MRKNILLLALAQIGLLNAQTTNNTGKVGINTEDPKATLHINGNAILGTATEVGSSGTSSVVRDNATGELKVIGKSADLAKPINYIVFEITTVDGDWLINFDTKIPSEDYTLVVVGNELYHPNDTSVYLKASVTQGGAYNIAVVDSFIEGGTWRLRADHVNAGLASSKSTGKVNGSWRIKCLAIDNSMVNILPVIRQDLRGRNRGVSSAKPDKL